jgi:enoyl-CoA hydratase/carnithine racemase
MGDDSAATGGERSVESTDSHDDLVAIGPTEDGVVEVRLQNPPMNALSQELLVQLRDGARALGADASVKAVVVAGGEKAFAAGADISQFGDQDAARAISRGFREAFDAIAAIPRPVVAAIRGYALGGGLELAMACDLRVAAETARLGQPEILLGIIPGAGGTQRLARLVGPARAKEIIWSGRQIRADEAHAIGLVDRVVRAGEEEHTARHWATELGKGPVVAMGLAKRVIDDGLGRPLADGLDLERDAFVEVFGTEDARTGVQSFLADGPGKATFRGR